MRLSPSRPADPGRAAALAALPFAHRGLHGPGLIENSRAAFAAAIAAGHGIELDVQASRDGEAMVIHDYALDRLTAAAGQVAELSSAQLGAIALRGTSETIPTLSEALALIASRAPLLIEIKAPHRRVARLCLSVFRSLAGYRGVAAIMSFNPEVPRWFARHAPRVVRGLVVTEGNKRGVRFHSERRIALWRARPDFLACDIRDLPSRFAAAQRRRGLPILAWTVRSDHDRARAAAFADQIIYEVPR